MSGSADSLSCRLHAALRLCDRRESVCAHGVRHRHLVRWRVFCAAVDAVVIISRWRRGHCRASHDHYYGDPT